MFDKTDIINVLNTRILCDYLRRFYIDQIHLVQRNII